MVGRRRDDDGEAIDITPVLEHFGIKVPHRQTGWITTKCVFHQDRNASARVTLENGGAFTCNACGAKGDAVTLLIDRGEAIDRAGALKIIEEDLGGSVPTLRKRAAQQRRKPLSGKERDWERGSDLFQAGIRRKPFGRS